MAATKSKFRSNFGASCVRCSDYLIAPERSEYRDTRRIVHAWLCSKCGFRFEVIVPTDKTPAARRIGGMRLEWLCRPSALVGQNGLIV